MRPGQQQNRRGRNRHQGGGGGGQNGGHHRKQQNPLARSWESNGPDVKVRGTPHHIAEKYMALARDAQSSGDPVLAENYLQHAEHYNRIIMAYAEQFQTQGGEGGQPFRYRQPGEPGDMDDGSIGDEPAGLDPSSEQPQPGDGPSMATQGQPQGNFQNRGDRQERYNRHDQGRNDQGRQEQGRQDQGRPDQGQFRDRSDRGFEGQDRQFRRDNNGQRYNNDRYGNGNNNDRYGGDRGERGNRDFRDQRRDRFPDQPGRGDRPDGIRPEGNRPEGQGQGSPGQAPQQQGERRFDRDRDRGYRNDRGDRGDRFGDRPERQDRDRASESGSSPPTTDAGPSTAQTPAVGQPQHERYVPERRPQRTFPQAPSDQPAPEWVERDRAERVEAKPQISDTAAPAVQSASPPDVADSPVAAPARGRRKVAAAVAPTGERFQEHNQPSFLAAPRRRTKAEKSPPPETPDEPKGE